MSSCSQIHETVYEVVYSDPKSRTGAEDKKALLQMWVYSMLCITSVATKRDPVGFTRTAASTSRSHGTIRTCWSCTAASPLVRHYACWYEQHKLINIVYQAYDIKLIIDKGFCDIIRPQWILDCVAKGEIVPLTKK